VHLDFELLLVLLTLFTGVIWAWDRFYRRKRVPEDQRHEPPPWYIDFPKSLFPVILAVLLIRGFVAEPFRIPSGSMVPTLLTGDFILVNKSSYGLRWPVLGTRIIGNGAPERGEVAVFKYPVDPSQDYIKRVVGLPGDTIEYRNKTLYVNGEAVAQEEIGQYDGLHADSLATLHRETLDAGDYKVLVHERSPSGELDAVEVPEGMYFTIGDNRDRSADSRMWGFVPDEYLVGRAFLIWMSWDVHNNRVDWGRIGEGIQ